jgi:alkanesulfonate monooxygenase SsuD/methylene tetrahydromethanopterin reductase-like flavin-dependent oxidoreductase (luciferase family)
MVLGDPPLTPRARGDRFAEFTELLDVLLRTGQVTWHGEYYTAVDARSTPGCVQAPRIPFVVAANGPRSMRTAVRFGQGWVTSGTRTDDLEQWWHAVAEAGERFTEALDAAGLPAGAVPRYLSLDAAPVFSLTSMGAFQDAVGHARQCGFTDVIVHWPRPSGWYAGDESILDDVAAHIADLHDA